MTWRNKTIVLALRGLLPAILPAYIVIQRAERENVLPELTPVMGLKIGLGVLGVLRLVADLGDRVNPKQQSQNVDVIIYVLKHPNDQCFLFPRDTDIIFQA